MKISINEVVTAVRDLAKQYPEAVYKPSDNQECAYTKGFVVNGPKSTGCLLGQALARFVPRERLEEKDDFSMGFSDFVAKVGIEWVEGDNLGISLAWLFNVQSRQDAGDPWGVAVSAVDEMMDIPAGDPDMNHPLTRSIAELTEVLDNLKSYAAPYDYDHTDAEAEAEFHPFTFTRDHAYDMAYLADMVESEIERITAFINGENQ